MSRPKVQPRPQEPPLPPPSVFELARALARLAAAEQDRLAKTQTAR